MLAVMDIIAGSFRSTAMSYLPGLQLKVFGSVESAGISESELSPELVV